MKIAGQEYMMNQNDRLRIKLQENINVDQAAAQTKVNNNVSVPSNNNEDKNDNRQVTLDFSTSARVSGTEAETSKNFPTTNFDTTTNNEESNASASGANSSVINQYRFFVQSNQYEDSDGVVKRIFR